MQHADIAVVSDLLRARGQEHLLRGLSELDPVAREAFLARLADLDWDELAHPAAAPQQEEVRSSHVVTLDEALRRRGELLPPGEAAYAAGQVAVLMVAGGQGTRLGSDEPKGCFPIGPLSGKTLYQIQTEKVLALSRRVGRTVPLLIMTSPATDQATRAYFAAHGDFGLAPGQLRLFSQGTVPSLDLSGQALLAAPGKLQENPDGHGGCFTALWRSGQLLRLGQEGVGQIVYIQVDNLLAPVDDPILVGLAVAERTDVITKVLEKAGPDERVGHLVRVGGRDRIIEYTELTPAQVRLPGPDGQPIYRWGSPAMHCFAVRFLLDLCGAGFRLPLHRSRKPVKAWLDGRVQEVQGWKSERFIFDLLPAAQTSLGLEVRRTEEFAPIKNHSGADSPQTAVALAEQLYAGWLAGVGVRVDPGAHIEISPLYAATEADLRRRWGAPFSEVRGDLYLSEGSVVAAAPPRSGG